MGLSLLRLNKALARFTSLDRFQIRKDLRSMAKQIGQNNLVLDVGCGVDRPYQSLFSYDKYFGVDLYEPADLNGDITYLPFCSDIADLIICSEVLEHVPEPGIVLHELHRVLKTQRFLILTVPFLWGEHDYVDHHRWTRAGLYKILLNNGFEILYFKRRGRIFSLIGSTITQIPRQVFGSFGEQRNWLIRVIYLFCIFMLLPLPWFCYLLDPLDRRQEFVRGINVLCRRV